MRRYFVLIDGTKVGALREGETATFDVPPGSHEVRIKIDWVGSRSAAVRLAEGEIAHFRCRADRRSRRRDRVGSPSESATHLVGG
jgi:hypothetical protein